MSSDRSTDGPREKRLRALARRLIGDDVEEGSIKEFVSAVVDTGDKAKTEAVKMVAREVRTYLDELRVKDDLLELLTNYSVEVKASIHLKPLAEALQSPSGTSAGASAPPSAAPSPPTAPAHGSTDEHR